MKELIKKHLEAHKGLEQASIKNFAETGKISGSFFIALKEMIKEDRAEQLRLHGVSQHRELLIDCVRTCLKDKDSITVEQQVGNYLFLKGN